MEIKYEAVFGPQELFDGAPEYIEFIRFNDYSREHLWGDSNSINHLTFKDLKAIPIVAMRRIIRTPTWTAADQKAGKLPEVGAKFKARGYAWECVRILNNTILAVVGDSYCGFELNECTPIETPEEKAARLRVEWCKKAIGCAPISSEMQHYEMKRLGKYVGNIHDALLSGELPMPKKEDE